MKRWVVASATVFGLIAACFFAWLTGEYFGLDKNSWPAWVQAIGAIATIAAAFVINTVQQRNAWKQHVIIMGQQKRDRLGGILAIVEHAQNLIREVSEEYMVNEVSAHDLRNNHLTQYEHQLGYAHASLLAIPLHDVNDYVVVDAIHLLVHAVENTRSSLKILSTPQQKPFNILYERIAASIANDLNDATFGLEHVRDARHNIPRTVIG